MTITEYAVLFFFIAVALFGVVDAIRTPLIVKRFYRNLEFVDGGKKTLIEPEQGGILQGMYTEHLYSNQYKNLNLSQCKAWSVKRRQFTLSKATRKRNRTAWSVTVIHAESTMIAATLLPTIVPEAVVYITDGTSIDFPDDSQIASRYHVRTDEAGVVRAMLAGEVREFLVLPDVVTIEATENLLVLKRSWSDEKVLDRLQVELDIAVLLHNHLVDNKHS